jgi:phage gp46-like protein
MDFNIETIDGQGVMTFTPSRDIMNNIYLSLLVKKGSFFARPEFGSRLHELTRAKNTESTASLARDYCREALQWLIDTGRAKSFDIQSERDRTINPNRLKLSINVTQADLTPVTFEFYQEVI